MITSETTVSYFQTTRRNIPEDSHLHTDIHFNDHKTNAMKLGQPGDFIPGETYFGPSRILGSHGGEYEDGCLLGCSAV
jgi:hypothetical protein